MKTNRSQWSRRGIFNLVGLFGFGIQLLALFLFKRVVGFDYRLAIACAVEVALAHNFIWHERVTWADVISRRRGVWTRLLRFHAANGLISIAGNVAFTWTFVTWGRMPYLLANAISVVICSLLNFAVGDRFVFRSRARDRGGPTLWRRASGPEIVRRSERAFVQDGEEFSGHQIGREIAVDFREQASFAVVIGERESLLIVSGQPVVDRLFAIIPAEG